MKFHSPYQFIQVTGRRGQGTSGASQGGVVPYPGGVVPQEDQNPLPPEQAVRHDRWQRGTYSGRLVCRLTTTRSPLLVGAEQSSGACDSTPGVIEPFRVQEGLAIPGSALRGLLSSVAETVSQSALRVLDNKEYSVRKVSGCLHQSFAQDAKTPDVLPWNPERNTLTPAECLFGVVEEGLDEQDSPARNLASRVRLSDALPLDKIKCLDSIPLRALSSPNPPSPAMYFRSPDGGCVRKTELDLNRHVPNGRKFYLHHWPQDTKKDPWASRIPQQGNKKKVRSYVRQGGRRGAPIASDQAFFFHIDFENLSPKELELLRTAIEPAKSPLVRHARSEFLHKLGWGKPVGLGSVELQVLGCFVIDRCQRYTLQGLLQQPRYHCWWGQNVDQWPQGLSDRYPLEAEAARSAPYEEAERDSAWIDEATLRALLTIGNPENLKAVVSYPFSALHKQRPHDEGENFRWFVENDKHPEPPHYQCLSPVGPKGVLSMLHDQQGHGRPSTQHSRSHKKRKK
jgi:hypothetical protein